MQTQDQKRAGVMAQDEARHTVSMQLVTHGSTKDNLRALCSYPDNLDRVPEALFSSVCTPMLETRVPLCSEDRIPS